MKPGVGYATRGRAGARCFLHHGPSRRNGQSPFRGDAASITSMAETTQTVEERLQGIGTQLDWVREYL